MIIAGESSGNSCDCTTQRGVENVQSRPLACRVAKRGGDSPTAPTTTLTMSPHPGCRLLFVNGCRPQRGHAQGATARHVTTRRHPSSLHRVAEAPLLAGIVRRFFSANSAMYSYLWRFPRALHAAPE